MTLPFGKYRDVEIENVPDHYLLFLASGPTGGLEWDLLIAIRAELYRRTVEQMTVTLSGMRAIHRKLLRCFLALRRRAKRLDVDRQALQDLDEEIIRLLRCRRS